MEFVFNGFRQDNNVRHYAFERVGSDSARTRFLVDADLGLIRKYDITVQELPLLCRRLLERRPEGEPAQTITFTEEDMRAHASTCAAARLEAAQKRKPHRRPASHLLGQAWRAPNQ